MARIDLTGKPIAITGASSGIGRATALACAAAGMPVALGARREDRLQEVADQIRASGGTALHQATDVTSPEHCRSLIERTAEAFGGIYAVFANAGYGFEAPVFETTDEAMRAIFETNFFGTLNTIRPALERMIAAHAGHVLICSSCVARFALPYFSAYSASKAAQHHIGRAMNLELSPMGIHVSTVMPIGTRTEFFDQARARSGGQMIDHAPSGMLHSPERVARAIVRTLRRPRPEVWTSRPVRLGMAIAAALPRTSDLGVRWMVRKHRHEHGDDT